MENTVNFSENLKCLKMRLKSLALFRQLLCDPVLDGLCKYLDASDAESAVDLYADFVSRLYECNQGKLGLHILDICENSENVYVKLKGQAIEPADYIKECAQAELETLQTVADLTPEVLTEIYAGKYPLPRFEYVSVDIAGSFYMRAENIGKYGYGIYAKNHMFYVDNDNRIVPVKNPDGTRLSDLVDYEKEREIIVRNTLALIDGKPAANILLTGDAGTGKSSTVKAVVNELFNRGIRIIEIRKDQLSAIPELLDMLAENPLKFILFIDDLSFLKDDDNFNGLKAVLEGSVSAKSKNVVIYATSNRRHIIKEKFSDREGDDIHRNDTLQELLSLSERFGIHITFQKPDKVTFLHIVENLATAAGIDIPPEKNDALQMAAERFALERGGRSARLAKQFIDGVKAGNFVI